MMPTHLDLVTWEVTIAERQGRVRNDIQALRHRRAEADLARHPGALRRYLGQALIALGHRLTAPAGEPLPAQPALGAAAQR